MLANGERYCPRCKPKAEAKFKSYTALYEQRRAVWDEQYRRFYNSKEWREFRLVVLKERPFCPCGRFAGAVHHIIPLKECWDRRLDKTNVQPLCASCHSRHELTHRNTR